MPTLRFLGTGTSTGVPQMGCECAVCQSQDPRDRRLRTSALIETEEGKRLLIDCGPDFREQMLSVPFKPLEAVLLTHEHYDHVGGLDDLRPFSVFGQVDVYADEICSRHLQQRIPYCFLDNKYPGVPNIVLHVLQPRLPFFVAGYKILPVQVMHGHLPVLGYKVGEMAYLTDMSQMSVEEKSLLHGLKVLVVNALRQKPHHSHQTLDEALQLVDELKPERTYLIHMSHQIGLHKDVEKQLPSGVFLAYDGLQISW